MVNILRFFLYRRMFDKTLYFTENPLPQQQSSNARCWVESYYTWHAIRVAVISGRR